MSTHRSNISESTLSENENDMFKDQDDPLWAEYVKKASVFDKNMIDEWNKILDVILVYVALFTSVLTSFIVQTTTKFKRDPADISNDLLVAIYKQLAAQSNNTSISTIDTDSIFNQNKAAFDDAILYNALLYSSLALCIVVSVIALAAKLWLISYSHRVFSAGSPYEKAMKRQEAYSGVLAWKMGVVINSLPLVLLVALIMFGFFIHRSLYLTPIAYGVGTIITVGFISLAVTSFAAAFSPACPFHSSFSDIIRGVFTLPQKLSVWGRNKPSAGPQSKIRLYAVLTLMWAASSAVLEYAIFKYSSAFYPLVCIPAVISFAYAMQEADHKPQKYRFPHLVLLTFGIVAPALIAAGHFRNPQEFPFYIALFSLGMLATFLGGCMASRISKSMRKTGETDAIAWLLTSTPSQNSTLFKKVDQIASDPDYRPRILESLMPLLSRLITSHRTDGNPDDLETYVTCLAQLSDFTDHEGSFWRMWEDQRWHPMLESEDPLRIKLMELAASSRYPSSLKCAASMVLRNYELSGQGKKHLTLQGWQTFGTAGSRSALVGPAHSHEEMELHSGRQNEGYSTRLDV